MPQEKKSLKEALFPPMTVKKICIVAFAIVLNVVGGWIALTLHLPIFLDSMGTILIAILYGPFYGILPPLLYGLVMGFTADIYSLYFAPVGMILGCITGIVAKQCSLAVSHPREPRSSCSSCIKPASGSPPVFLSYRY